MQKELLKPIITVLVVLLVFSTTAMIYFSNLKSVAFDRELYASEYDKYDVRDNFDDSVNLTFRTEELLAYLETGDGEIQSDFYNDREKTHLVEVRSLFKMLTLMLTISVWISIIAMMLLITSVKKYSEHLYPHEGVEYFKKMLSSMLIGIGAAVDAIALGFMAMIFTFSVAFVKFHEMFFKTDTWMLNPMTDNLIKMFPEPFFFDLFVRIVLTSVVFATIMLFIGFLIKLGKPTVFDRIRKH